MAVRDPTPNNDPIWIRVNCDEGKPPKLIETKRSDWLFHTNRRIDVCVYPFDYQKHNANEDLAITTLNSFGDGPGDPTIIFTEELQKHWGLSLGDEVFIVGCFIGLVGDRKNIPVIRMGSIAAKPDEPIAGVSHQNPAYLIETRSLGGVSGSPVFIHMNPGRRLPKPELSVATDGKSKRAPYFLIGMMQGFHSGQYAGDFISDDDEQKIVPVDTDFNAGIGVAIPMKQVMDLINRADLAEARMATIQAKKKQTGHHDASAPAPKVFPPASDVNPKHREDFTSLVTAAAQKREQED